MLIGNLNYHLLLKSRLILIIAQLKRHPTKLIKILMEKKSIKTSETVEKFKKGIKNENS